MRAVSPPRARPSRRSSRCRVGVDAERDAASGDHAPQSTKLAPSRSFDRGMALAQELERRDLGALDLALGGGGAAVEQAGGGEDHAAGAHASQRPGRRRTRAGNRASSALPPARPARSAGHDQHVGRRAVGIAVIGEHAQAVGRRTTPGSRRDGEGRDLGRDAARHRQHAVGGEVDRLDAVVDVDREAHGSRSSKLTLCFPVGKLPADCIVVRYPDGGQRGCTAFPEQIEHGARRRSR